MTPLEIANTVERAISHVYGPELPPNAEDRVELLAAIRGNQKSLLYHNPGGGWMLIPLEREVSQCVGAGGFGIGLYFARSLFKEVCR